VHLCLVTIWLSLSSTYQGSSILWEIKVLKENPYYHRGPIRDARYFYGRARETALALQMVKNRQSVSVVGPRRIGGKIADFGGDSVMALFGVPTERPDDAIRAVRAALEIQTNVASYARELKQDRGIDFSARVGLDTGVVVLGEIGGGQRAEFTALGEAVNLACRIRALAEPGTVLITNHTYRQVRGRFRTGSLGSVQVKGKSWPIKAYQVLEERADRR
jgi:class 3 adenylate cyclase